MSDDQKREEEELERDNYEEYIKEMENLKTDFSDLEEMDLDEIQDMKEAIEQVKEDTPPVNEPSQTEQEVQSESSAPQVDVIDKKEEMMMDFSDLGKMDLDELLQMKEGMEAVKEEEKGGLADVKGRESHEGTSDELERKIQDELRKKKQKEAQREKKEIQTEEDFIDYIKAKRDKIWYHALHYLAFEVEDHTASKYLLYDVLKEDTSKSPIDPLPEHQFYFGLGYILRLKIKQNQIVRYLGDGKFRIKYDVDKLKKILEQAGEPIITKPTIA